MLRIIGGRSQDVEQESACRVLLVRVEALGDGDKPDSVVLQDADAAQAIDQGSAEPVQLPHQEGVEFPCHGVGHQPVQAGPGGLGAAGNVLVEVCDLPALPRSMVLDLAELECVVLVGVLTRV
jgi:hypothetical protein